MNSQIPISYEYKTDLTGSRITNIPYNDFICNCTADENCIYADISSHNTGEINSRIINSAIESISNSGGGTLLIPEGEYIISTIEIKSNVTLFIQKNSKLVSLSCNENSASESSVTRGVVVAYNASDIRITGGGVIYGNGVSYTDEPETEEPLYALEKFNTCNRVIEARKRIRFGKKNIERNSIIYFKDCENVVIDDIILNESAFWTLVINGCKNVNINHIVIDNHMHVANTDGIDILLSKNVTIDSCFIATADDGIVLKPIDGEIKNVSISNCVVSSFANCFKIGTETAYDVSNVAVKNCKFFIPSNMTYGYSGIAIESADGSNISDIEIDDIIMDGISSPILIWLGNRLRYGNTEIGSINNISIRNVNSVNSELPSAVTGCKADGKVFSVKNVELNNINVVYRDTKENLTVLQEVPEWSMSDYPDIVRISHIYRIDHEHSDYWDLPCYGIFIRYADNINYLRYNCIPRTCNKRDFDFVKK